MIPLFSKPQSPLIQNYLAAVKNKPSGKTPVKELRFAVLDTETSGLNVRTDHILSIALFEIIDGQIDIARCRKWIVFQPETAPTAATAIHGILPSETRKGMDEKKVLEELIPLLTGAIVVGHHIRFDASMLNEAMLRHFKTKFCNRMVDTASMAMNELIAFHRSGYANQRPPSLDEVCSQLNLPVVARHTAEGDAFLAAQVFLLLCGKIRRRLQSRRLHRRSLQWRDLPIVRLRK
jgi:DNA polymerase-3 subunit epsilon